MSPRRWSAEAPTPGCAIETLLLRWVLMDRTVDLESVLGGSAVGRLGDSGRPPVSTGARNPAIPADRPTDQPTTSQNDPPSPQADEPPQVDFTLEGLLRARPDLVTAARSQSRFLGEALAAARPTQVEAPAVQPGGARRQPDPSGGAGTAAGCGRAAPEPGLGQDRPRHAGRGASRGGGSSARARRLSDAEARAERLKALKARDPALEAAADSLDLEVLD